MTVSWQADIFLYYYVLIYTMIIPERINLFMKITTSSITKMLLAIALFTALGACAPQSKTTYIPLENELYANISLNKGRTVVQYSENEPEAVLEEELKELNKIGGWEDNVIQAPPVVQEPEKVTYDFPVTVNKQVEFYLDLFQNRQRNYFQRWLARSGKYVPYIQENLKEAGLPEDLAYLAMIESGFNPSAYSKAHAVGLWQFIRSTGKDYRLRIDGWVDERRNPEKATHAAINYLSVLYGEFNSWHLAVAAYNAGGGKIRRGLKKYKADDFWELAGKNYLKLETKRYVPKLIAAIIIAKEPEKYGFTNIDFHEPNAFDSISVPPMTDLNAVAIASNQSLKTIKKLNNELLKNYTPPGKKSYTIRIPSGSYSRVAANLQRLHPVVTTDYKTHVVRRGDTLTAICRSYNINKTTLLKANNLHSAKLLAGQRLRIPFQATKYVLLKQGETPESRFAAAEEGGRLYIHQIKRGETLSRIARLYNVTPDIIVQWNNLASVNRIKAGDNLALYLDQNGMPASVVSLQKNTISTATVTANAKNPAAKEPSYYRVKQGDSLWTIARMFQVSLKQIKQWNNLTSNLIHPGRKLVIKKV